MNARELCETALQALRDNGAEGDVYIEQSRSLRLGVRSGVLESLSRSDVHGMAVRAMKDGRLGFVHTARLDTDSIAEAARQACVLSEFGSKRDDLILAAPSGPGDGGDEGEQLHLHDSSLEMMTLEAKRNWILEAEAAGMSHDGRIVRSGGASWREDLRGRWIANTNGLLRHYRRSGVGVSVDVVAEAEGSLQSGGRGFDVVRAGDLPDPSDLGREAADRAVQLLGGTPVATGRYPVVFSPDAGGALMAYTAIALNGEHLSRGRSWLAERLEGPEEVRLGSDLITIRDSGRMKHRTGSAPFDGEGVDTRDQFLVNKGIVAGRLCDLASAKRLGIPPTGNASRGSYESAPEIRAHNLHLEPGSSSLDEVLESVEKGLWIWGLSGWWTGMNPSNPQFSSAAFGLWIENGRPVRPVARVTIAGTLEEMLGGVDAVADDLVWTRDTNVPTFRVKELMVSGV